MDKKIISILKKVQKPARYIGGEVNICPIGSQMRVRFCLMYPGLYEEGMASPDVRILYHLLNDRKGYGAERCFAPYIDMGKELIKAKYPLFSLETKDPVSKFDILAFPFTSELQYTTFLYMLELAGIPLESKNRKDFPLVYGFGKCMANPKPLGNFLDFAIIGDWEDATIKVVDTIMKCKLSKLNKNETLRQISQIDGVWVPKFEEVKYKHNGQIDKIEGKVIKRQIIRDLDRTYFPTKLIVSNEETSNECAFVEIMRGCDKGCRFCTEGFINRPVRARRVQTILAEGTSQLVNSGYDELNLYSYEANLYKKLSALVNFVDPTCRDRNAKWSVANHRSETFDSSLTSLKKTKTITLSIEAGSEKLRRVINKNLSDFDIEGTLISAFHNGYASVKLSLMTGLPYETADDLMAIVNLAIKIKKLYKDYHTAEKPLNIMVETNTFVPKPFTPFMWCAFVGEKEARKRQEFLKLAFEKIGVKYVCDNPAKSEVEALLSRGDQRLGKFILASYRQGAVFNSDDLFNAEAYKKAINQTGIDKDLYLGKKDFKEVLPFSNIDIGLGNEFFERELKKAQRAELTLSCSSACAKCGLHKSGVCSNGRS